MALWQDAAARRRVSGGALVALTASMAFGGGCKDANDVVGPPTPRPQPTTTTTPTRTATAQPASPTPLPPTATPPPAGELTGNWSGTFEEDDYKGSSDFCNLHNTASAVVSHSGSEVTGTLYVSAGSCGAGGPIQGTFSNGTLTGVVLKSGYTGGAFSGTATANRIELRIEKLVHDNGNGTGLVVPPGNLTLTR